MTLHTGSSPSEGKQKEILSLYHLLDPEVLANPYPLYHRLRSEDPVHWDPYLHAWIVTRYADVITVFQRFSANRTFTPEQLTALGLQSLTPLAKVMVLQMLFLDPPAHARVRGLASKAFTARRVEKLRSHIQDITDSLLDAVQEKVCRFCAGARQLPAQPRQRAEGD
jgi:pimeloyl-[acyl-carrier protein] synthase